ncbi:MAG TPA: RICIN domain-containing protein [Bacillota bacterium]
MFQKRFLRRFLVLTVVVVLFASSLPGQAADLTITNGTQFRDTNGNIIHAHGGGMIKVNPYYYWYGEHRDQGGHFLGVSCYRSTDLVNWEYRGDVLTKYSAAELNSCWVERPKVMYNPRTGQFVMWMHWEDGVNYGKARCAVAYSNSPDGSFIYQGSFRPYQNQGVTDHGQPGYMSRDCNVFVDTDGTGYFISAANENMDLHLYRLTPDFRNIATLVAKLFVGQQREAPCLIKRNNYYYLITSGCTGWSPNQAKYAYSTNLSSGWSGLYNLGNSNTYRSQPAYIIPVQGSETTTYLYTGDRWAGAWGGPVMDSQYVWLPLIFNSDTSLTLDYGDLVTINAATGRINLTNYTYYKIVNQLSNKLIDVKSNSVTDGGAIIQYNDNGGHNQHWRLVDLGGGYKKLINRNSGKVLEVYQGSTANAAEVVQWSDLGGANQQWLMTDTGNGWFKFTNRNSGKLLETYQASTANGARITQYTDNGGANQRWKLVPVQ